MRKKIMAFTLVCILACSPVKSAGIPVYDASNWAENMAQVAKQLEQFALQLQQYQNMLLNTLAPFEYIWGNVQNIVNQAKGLLGVLQGFQFNFEGGIGGGGGGAGGCSTGYYGDYEHYSQQSYIQSPILRNVNPYRMSTDEGYKERKKAYDELMEFLSESMKSLEEQASMLEDLGSNAESAEGRMAAIQSSNQLLQFIGSQLVQIQTHMIARDTAQGLLAEKAMADDARREAADRMALREDGRVLQAIEDTESFSLTAD